MTLRIRQIVLATRQLAPAVQAVERTLGLQVAYRDPLIAEFGLHNALLPIGDQFLEVLAPTQDNTAAGRHLDRHGDSAYMLILQTDDLARERTRLQQLGVRTVWEAEYPDMRALHLHPKDIGAAIVSLDQPTPPESWRWAGPDWQKHVSTRGAREIREVIVGAIDAVAMARRWAEVLGTPAPHDQRIDLRGGVLSFREAPADRILGFRLAMHGGRGQADVVSLCGAEFQLT
jgi:hypothetical protein